MSNRVYFVNGKFVDTANATLHISDLAVQRGYGVFDFFKTINGSPVFLDDHLSRLYNSANAMRLHFALERQELKAILYELMDRNQIPNSGIRITVTGGYSADMYSLAQPNITITQLPLDTQSLQDTLPLKLVTYNHQRQMPTVKTIDYLMAVWLQPYIKQHDAGDVLYVNNGMITELPRSSIFMIAGDGSIVTAANNVLKGVVRTNLIRHFGQQFNIVERDIALTEMYNAEAVFVTSTTKNVQPVSHIDGKPIGTTAGMAIMQRLGESLRQLIAEDIARPLAEKKD